MLSVSASAKLPHDLGTKVGENASNISNRAEPLDVQTNGVKTIEEHIEIDFDDGAAWIHTYVGDLAHRHAPKPNGARDVQTEDILGGVGDHGHCGTPL